MKKRIRKITIIAVASILLIGILFGIYFVSQGSYGFSGRGPIKILYVDSYGPDWEWSVNQYEGFNDYIQRNIVQGEGIDVEINLFYMDTKNMETIDEKKDAASRVIKRIEEWGPDLIYATDDNAQEYVISKKYINSKIPIVVSGVNAKPEDYGYSDSKNIAGVLERIHTIETLDLLREISPYSKRILMIGDGSVSTKLIFEDFKKNEGRILEMGFEIVDIIFPETFEEYKNIINEYSASVDAIGFFPLATIKDEDGDAINDDDVQKWTTENSQALEFTFWDFGVNSGMLLAVGVSSYEQGKLAGEFVYNILINGVSPSSLGFEPTSKGNEYINLARVKQLNLEIPSIVLVNSEVIEKFPWE